MDSKPNNCSEKVFLELNPLAIELTDVHINPKADDEGEWVPNENPTFDDTLSFIEAVI